MGAAMSPTDSSNRAELGLEADGHARVPMPPGQIDDFEGFGRARKAEIGKSIEEALECDSRLHQCQLFTQTEVGAE